MTVFSVFHPPGGHGKSTESANLHNDVLFMTADEIKQRNSVFATELMRKFRTVNVTPDHSGPITQYYAISAREGGNPQLGASRCRCTSTRYRCRVHSIWICDRTVQIGQAAAG
jgi:hypothetical protein